MIEKILNILPEGTTYAINEGGDILRLQKWIFSINCLLLRKDELFILENRSATLDLSTEWIKEIPDNLKVVFIESWDTIYVSEYKEKSYINIRKIATLDFIWNIVLNSFFWKEEYSFYNYLWN